jgi:hypothetical protein
VAIGPGAADGAAGAANGDTCGGGAANGDASGGAGGQAAARSVGGVGEAADSDVDPLPTDETGTAPMDRLRLEPAGRVPELALEGLNVHVGAPRSTAGGT